MLTPMVNIDSVKLCECGCGLPAPIATRTQTSQGNVKGQPKRFILGHHGRIKRSSPPAPPTEDSRYIALTHDKFALVDLADYDRLSKYCWYASKSEVSTTFYALTHLPRVEGKRTLLLMHRLIMGVTDDQQVDHIDGNGLNNRRSNLRLCSNTENQHNRPTPVNNTSGYKGVSWHKHSRKWRAVITVNNSHVHLGYFDDKDDAARAYNEAAKMYFGEFARCNSPIGAW